MTMSVQHHITIRFMIPRQQRIMAHHYVEGLFQEGCNRRLEFHPLNLIDRLEIILVRPDGVIVIPLNEKFLTRQLLQQPACRFTL